LEESPEKTLKHGAKLPTVGKNERVVCAIVYAMDGGAMGAAPGELQELCERAASDPGDRGALLAIAEAAWAGEPHRCGSGVALSPLWGEVETATERRLVDVLLGRAAGGEEECRVLAGLIRGQSVRSSILGSDDEDELQSALVGVLERGDKHALFALFILAALIIDEPLGAELFSRANVIQTFHWTVSIVTEDCASDAAAAQACLELMQMLATRTDLVDAIEQHEDTPAQVTELVRSLPSSHGGVGVLHTLATASPSLARELATALAASEGCAALEWLVEALRGGTVDGTAERMLLMAMRFDPKPAQSLLKALLAAEGGVAMLAALTEQVFDRSSSQRSSGSGSQLNTQQQSSSQPEREGLTQELQIYSQADGEEGGDDGAHPAGSEGDGGASTNLVDKIGAYEAILAEERRSASMRMEAMATAAAAERQALQDEIEVLQKQMKEKAAKHETRVSKLTEVAKRERERRVDAEGICRRETDEASTSRRQLAVAKEELAQAQADATQREASARQGFETKLSEMNGRLVAYEEDAAARAASWETERQGLWEKLVIALDGYVDLEQKAEAVEQRAEAEMEEMKTSHELQLDEVRRSLATCEQRRVSAEGECQRLGAELKEAQAELRKLNKVSSLMSALIDTTKSQQAPAPAPAAAGYDGAGSPSLRSHGSSSSSGSSSGSAETGEGTEVDDRGTEIEEPEVLALSQSDQTPHREAKAHLRMAYRGGGAGSGGGGGGRSRSRSSSSSSSGGASSSGGGGGGGSSLRRCDATAGVVNVSTVSAIRSSSTSSVDSALSNALSAVHNGVQCLGGLQLPTWSQAGPDDSDGAATVHYGSQEPPPNHNQGGSNAAAPAQTPPQHSPAFEWQKEEEAASRNRRLAFLAMDPGGAGGSVMASTKPENRPRDEDDEDDEEDEEEDQRCINRDENGSRALPLSFRDVNARPEDPGASSDQGKAGKSSSSSSSRSSRRRRDRMKQLRAEVSCTQPAVGDSEDEDAGSSSSSTDGDDVGGGYSDDDGHCRDGADSTPIKSQSKDECGSQDDDGSGSEEGSTLGMSPELF
jgi:hypothetical protein